MEDINGVMWKLEQTNTEYNQANLTTEKQNNRNYIDRFTICRSGKKRERE